MLFNSLDFAIFLIVVYTAYWTIGIKRRVTQNLLILIASYTFYGLWDFRFLFLLFGSSLIDYFLARSINQTDSKKKRRFYLSQSVLWNIGVLIVFKYYDFFLRNFYALTGTYYAEGSFHIFNVVIPLGLSFYTFQTLSYTIDVYRGKTEPTSNLIEFMCFVSFFPQLVSGPIERTKDLLPQFEKQRSFNAQETTEGLRQILWGLFKKVLIADVLAQPVSSVFAQPEAHGAITLFWTSLLFALQIYCDFSGYTDMAIGMARLFGFKLSQNFNLPYFARSMTDFWQRWHITLTRWFTDYVFVPLVKKGGRITTASRSGALLITMLLVGLWHGANWTFVLLGVYDGMILVLERIPIFKKKRTLARVMRRVPGFVSFTYFVVFITVHNVLFRADSLDKAFVYLKRMILLADLGKFSWSIEHTSTLVFSLILVLAEVYTKRKTFPLERLEELFGLPARIAIYYMLIALIILFNIGGEAFIYFQF